MKKGEYERVKKEKESWVNNKKISKDLNKANHIFANKLHDHWLDFILNKFNWDKLKAYEYLKDQVRPYIDKDWIFEKIIELDGKKITIRWYNRWWGDFDINTAFTE